MKTKEYSCFIYLTIYYANNFLKITEKNGNNCAK